MLIGGHITWPNAEQAKDANIRKKVWTRDRSIDMGRYDEGQKQTKIDGDRRMKQTFIFSSFIYL